MSQATFPARSLRPKSEAAKLLRGLIDALPITIFTKAVREALQARRAGR